MANTIFLDDPIYLAIKRLDKPLKSVSGSFGNLIVGQVFQFLPMADKTSLLLAEVFVRDVLINC